MLKKIRNYIIVIVLIALYLWTQNNIIEIETIEIDEEVISNEIIIAHISDVHIPRNGPSIDNILEKLRDINPDLILTTGDIVDSSCNIANSQLDVFAKGLSEIAPTYGISGNHDRWNRNRELWYKIMAESNNIILENSGEVVRIKDQDIFLIGVKDGYSFTSEGIPEEIKNKNIPKILMIHRPNEYKYDNMDISLILAGHNHGGQVRIPFINQGILSPERKLFTKYTSGLYELENNEKLIISRGLGNSVIPVRIHNRPHIPIIILK